MGFKVNKPYNQFLYVSSIHSPQGGCISSIVTMKGARLKKDAKVELCLAHSYLELTVCYNYLRL